MYKQYIETDWLISQPLSQNLLTKNQSLSKVLNSLDLIDPNALYLKVDIFNIFCKLDSFFLQRMVCLKLIQCRSVELPTENIGSNEKYSSLVDPYAVLCASRVTITAPGTRTVFAIFNLKVARNHLISSNSTSHFYLYDVYVSSNKFYKHLGSTRIAKNTIKWYIIGIISAFLDLHANSLKLLVYFFVLGSFLGRHLFQDGFLCRENFLTSDWSLLYRHLPMFLFTKGSDGLSFPDCLPTHFLRT